LDRDVTAFRRAPAEDIRRLIARAMLGPDEASGAFALGRITLRPHQLDAAERVVAMIERHRGAMLADPVGFGKTYTSLAVAARLGAARCVIAVPASLRDMWVAAMNDCDYTATLITHEALSRSAAPRLEPDLVIVDESHRLRNPGTKRYGAMAELCAQSRVLLVSATPVQNARADLAAQLALFLGRAAWTMRDHELARHVVRGATRDARDLPRLSGPHIIPLAVDDECVDDILSLPPPVPARDETTAVALLVYGLIHQWTSSRAALVSALERRLARGIALTSVLETGHRPSRAELAAWTWTGDAVQLAFPEIVAQHSSDDGGDVAEILDAVRAHHGAIEALVARLRRLPNPDDARAAALREIRRRHAGERVIAFCHYTETVRALWQRLSREPGVAALTAHGARVAGGRISRETVLRQLEPRPSNARATPSIERIDLLIATDVLSEGLNLHAASVVVHLDYPWNPARLDQRVGRVRRLGSPHDAVTVYALAPPVAAERLLRIDERLRDKLRVAERAIGVAGRILPSPIARSLRSATDGDQRGLAEAASDVRARLRAWLGAGGSCRSEVDESRDGEPPLVALVASDVDGFVALVLQDGEPRLVADMGHGIDASPATVAAALELRQHALDSVDDAPVAAAIQALTRWLDARFGASTIELGAATASRARRVALARVAQAMSRTPRHRRAMLAPLANAARSVATAPLAEGAERVLDSLVLSDLPDEAWLRSIAAFGELNVRPERGDTRGAARGRIVVVLVFVCEPPR
jgi:superfamily II DNA or RNA helicase